MPPLPGVDNLKYNTNLDGPGAEAAVDIQMTSEDFEELATASDEMASILRSYPSLISIENTYSAGKQQLDFQVLPEGRTVGLTSSDVARQLRSSFFGAEALREQVGRLERRTMVRLPKAERLVENDIDKVRFVHQWVGMFHWSKWRSVREGKHPHRLHVKTEFAPSMCEPIWLLGFLHLEMS